MATEVGVGAVPDDALAGVFHGLPLRSLAVVRCVCKAWRDVVDARALLRLHLHLLPLTVQGVFLNYPYNEHPHHFARPCSPSTIPRVDGTLSFLPDDVRRGSFSVLDHCNGLLLLCGGDTDRLRKLCVCNPATRRWTALPRWWEGDYKRHHRCAYAGAYIAFDPAESPQYQVILVPAVPKAPSPGDRWAAEEVQRRALLWEKEKDAPFCLDWFSSSPEDDCTAVGQWEFEQLPSDQQPYGFSDPCRYMEWPPAVWKLRVFSSSTGEWEDRDFVREGMPAGTTVERMRYWKRTLCRGLPGLPRAKTRALGKDPICQGPAQEALGKGRPSAKKSRYRLRRRYAVYHHGSLYVHCRRSYVTRLSLSKSKYQIFETPADVDECTKPYFGKLQNGVCFGIVHDHQLKIWILNESCGHMEWVPKYETVVRHYAEYLASMASRRKYDGSWTVEENIEIHDTNHDVKSLSEEGHEWDSDNDDTFSMNMESQKYFDDVQPLNIIGFHPHKDVVFMDRLLQVVAYHLNSTKIQFLGNSSPKYYYHSFLNPDSFIYTPCMIGDLLHGDQIGVQSSSED